MLMPTTDHALGDSVGRYRLLGEVARGGMGIVYVAAAQGPAGFSKLVALKELRPDLVQDDEFLTMFLEEARMAARLNHPNIVQTNDVDEHDGRHFIAMEYLEGRSFYHVLKRFTARGGFPQRLGISVIRDALGALDYAHELTGFDGRALGFVHRDISPHNIFLTFEGHTKVIDFGIAKARDSSLETKTGVLKGRVNYMAPEQLVRRCDRRSDIFSIGAILFELLSGRRLWKGLDEIAVLAALTRGEIPSLAAIRPDTPAALVAICQRALAPRPEDRYDTAAQMRDALDQHLWSTGGSPRNREISELLLQEFDLERSRTRTIIEGALSRLNAGEGGHLEALDLHEPGNGTINSSRRGSNPRSHTGYSRPGTSSVRRNEQSVMARLRDPSMPGVAASPSMVRANAALLPPVTTPVLEPIPAEPSWWALSRRRTWLVAGALATVFVGTTAAVALQHQPASPPAPEPVAATAAAPVPSGSAPALPAAQAPRELPVPHVDDTIMLSVGVTPSTAQIYIDGELMPSNPFIGRFLKAAGAHRLRAVAPGYQAKERTVSFADNVMIDLSLNAVPAPAAPARRESSRRDAPARRPDAPAQRVAAPAPSVAPAVAEPEPPKRSERKQDIVPRGEYEGPRRRVIDTNNPYGEER
jgi:serine/threonine-protein kinase